MKVKILFAPIPDTPNLEFVEVEDMDGQGVSVGEWMPIDDNGYYALVFDLQEPDLLEALEGALYALHYMDRHGLEDDLIDWGIRYQEAIAAVAKARGEDD
jgi:hypothetical protein